MTDKKAEPAWLKPVVDYVPLAIFFAAYLSAPKTDDNSSLLTATAALMIATAIALVISLIVARRVPMMPLITAIIVGVFGGLTLWLKDDTFIKMKPTIVEALFSLILLGGLLFKKPLLKPLLSSAWPMEQSITLRAADLLRKCSKMNTMYGGRFVVLAFCLFAVASPRRTNIVRPSRGGRI